MKTIQLILKGMLFWFSLIMIVLIFSGIDSIMYNCGAIAVIISLLICVGLVIACMLSMTMDDALIVSGAKLLDKLVGGKLTQSLGEDYDDYDNPSAGCSC